MSGLWNVALPSPPFSNLTYAIPDYLSEKEMVPGMRVAVPLGRSLRAAVLLSPNDKPPVGIEIKPIVWPLERTPLLDDDWLHMANGLSQRQTVTMGQVISSVVPKNLRTAQVRLTVHDGPVPRTFPLRDLLDAPQRELCALGDLWRGNKVSISVSAKDKSDRDWVELAVDPPWPLRPGATRQIEILEHLFDSGPQPRPVLLKALGGKHAQALKTLAQKELVVLGRPAPEEDATVNDCACSLANESFLHDPTDEQAVALEDLSGALASDTPETRLVHGITGSGKTFVYMSLARACLESGRSVLLLAPEVALACALHKAAQEAFPEREMHLYHGSLTPSRRAALFAELGKEDDAHPRLVIGTRSSLFLPLRNLGLVVVDEEHDESFKQEERLSYQAKEIAWFRIARSNGLLVLGSATPDIKTYHATKEGHIGRVDMLHRVGGRELPEIALVNVEAEGGSGVLAPSVADDLGETLSRGEQAVIMLNRRGYSPLMYCLRCMKVLRCEECDVGLTYHKARERLVCHYCGRSHGFPMLCPSCGSGDYLPLGEGTEQLEEKLAELLPDGASILRMDRDSTRRPERMERIVSDFAKGKAQVLVGTQMLSKGHHFPGVTRVVVADGDLGLNLPDYRASERTFQLLLQVAGRAGRGDKPGKVLIQTRAPDHPFWQFVLESDYHGFFDRELELRRRYMYPPFTRLALIRASYPMKKDDGPDAITRLGEVLMNLCMPLGVRLLGPAPAPLELLRGRRRFNCLLKAEDWPKVRHVFTRVQREFSTSQYAKMELRLSLDLDPVNML